MKTFLERWKYQTFHRDTPEDLQRREKRIQAAQVLADRIMRLELAFPVERVLLYGSVARRDDGPDSDIDLAVIIDCAEHQLQGQLRHELEQALRDCAREVSRESFGTELSALPFSLMVVSKSIYDGWGDFSAVISKLRSTGHTLIEKNVRR